MRRFTALGTALIVALGLSTANAAPIFFDDFDVDMGHFATSAQTSGTTNILKGTAGHLNVNTRVTAAPLEGVGNLNVRIEGGNQATPAGFPRIRILSGGAAAAPAGNVPFTVTAGTDGYIGFYYKVPAPGTLPTGLPAGLQFQLNLDNATTNVAADMKGGNAKPAIMDGQWHLMEWNIDNPAEWGGALGLGGSGTITNGSYTIDSIMPRYANSTGWTGYTGVQNIQIDFVTKNDGGSLALLVTPTVNDANIGQVLRNYGTSDLGPLTALDPDGQALTWSIVSVTGPGTPNLANFTVDPVTGELDFASAWKPLGTYNVTLRATDVGGLSDTGVMTFEVVIPEPATFTLFALAMVGLAGVFRRR